MLIKSLSPNVFLNTLAVTRVIITQPKEGVRDKYTVSCICGDEKWVNIFESDSKDACVDYINNELKSKF